MNYHLHGCIFILLFFVRCFICDRLEGIRLLIGVLSIRGNFRLNLNRLHNDLQDNKCNLLHTEFILNLKDFYLKCKVKSSQVYLNLTKYTDKRNTFFVFGLLYVVSE